MKRKRPSANQKPELAALAALKRAAKNAIELARRTGTPAWVLENGKLIDAAKPARKTAKNHRRA
jgi:hypothetical protein